MAPHLPIGVPSEPTPPPRPRLDVAPPAPGRLPADGPARFGQKPTVAPQIGRVPFDTESLTHLGKSNRLMRRVLVRHGTSGACSRSERRCLGSWRQRLVDYPFGGTRIRAGLSSRGGSRPHATGERETARRRGGTTRRAAWRGAIPLVCTGKPGDRPPARLARLPEQLPGKPARRAGRGVYRGAHSSSVATCASPDRGVAAG
jgi:hypothetical protein